MRREKAWTIFARDAWHDLRRMTFTSALSLDPGVVKIALFRMYYVPCWQSRLEAALKERLREEMEDKAKNGERSRNAQICVKNPRSTYSDDP